MMLRMMRIMIIFLQYLVNNSVCGVYIGNFSVIKCPNVTLSHLLHSFGFRCAVRIFLGKGGFFDKCFIFKLQKKGSAGKSLGFFLQDTLKTVF